MTQIDIVNRAQAIVAAAEAELKKLVLEAGKAVHDEVGKCEVALGDDIVAEVDHLVGSIRINGMPVSDFASLQAILKVLHSAPGIAGKAIAVANVAADEAQEVALKDADKVVEQVHADIIAEEVHLGD